ncbi:hypothetical protein MMPV_006953 [Pyropia vietnamensis]
MSDRLPSGRDPLLAAEEGHHNSTPPADAESSSSTSAVHRAWRWVVAKARELKAEVLALYLAMDDPRTPWVTRIGAAFVVGYALSPLDLIPDFIPVLGLLDDIILLPLGIWLVRMAIPAEVLADARERAAGMIARGERPPVNWVAGAVVVAIWLACAAWAAVALRGWLQSDKEGGDAIAAAVSGM